MPGGHLFRLRAGNNLSVKRGTFHLTLRRAEIEGFRFHDLRHTFSSRVRAFTDAFTVRDLLGHADIKMTGIYTTPQPEEMRRAVEVLSSAGGRGKVLEFKPG